jgi:TPP-dependent pyruvate/acetoin dehydrogenase alpha subunit
MTLRLDPHTTNDDALIYRSSKDIELDNTQYPISQFEQFLLSQNLLSAQNIQSIKTSARATVDQAAQHFLNAPSQEANHIKDYLYA